jgi:hypothetical protein
MADVGLTTLVDLPAVGNGRNGTSDVDLLRDR